MKDTKQMSTSAETTITFSPPSDARKIKDIYTAETEKISEPNSWVYTRVTVWYNAPDGSKIEVYTYDRNYSMLNTFMPFRQYKDGEWRDYAIISPAYVTFEVLELHREQAAKVIAVRPVPVRELTQEWIDMLSPATLTNSMSPLFGKVLGDQIPQEGFCGVDYYIPDIMDFLDPSDFAVTSDSDAFDREWVADGMEVAGGQYGWYSGCIWGDDSSWKLRYLDLSRISEGIVTEDERYGYWELPEGSLADNIELSVDGYTRINLAVSVFKDGRASKYTKKSLNWEESD